MIITALLVAFGIPSIIALAVSAVRRARTLSQRIADVQEEMAQDPRPPYAALAEILEEQERQSAATSRKGKQAHG